MGEIARVNGNTMYENPPGIPGFTGSSYFTMYKIHPFVFLAATLIPAGADDEIRFNRDIRPILSEYCFACHGPDEHDRKAKLRLDVKDPSAFESHDGITAIVPGKPDESELFYRITTEDGDEIMPPPETEKTMSPAEVELVKRWIAAGAGYEGHWAYQAPVRLGLDDADRRGPVDQLVDARLEQAGVTAAPAAAPHTLIRRLSFDLTGMPPTSKEVDEFLAAHAADPRGAISAAARRLLASPRYGERMASYWLDLVRYADTIGYHSDNPMNVYLYRQWVIGAFNANQPFDDFTREQIAGDLLPGSTVEQKVASGYNRLLQTTEEGGAQAKEYIAIYAADRVRNISSAWMGSTLGCAQCHDHKYDPFTARDFYSMAAFFADIREPAVGKREAGMQVPDEKFKRRSAELDAKIAALTKTTVTPTGATAAAQAEWEKGLATSATPSLGEWHLLGPLAGGDATKAFETPFGPEKGIDPNAAVGGKKWNKRPELTDGKVHALGSEANSAWYLYRTIKATAAAQLALSLGSDDGIRVWLNGEEKLKNNSPRGAAPGQEKITLDLKPGNNQFLMKIVNHGGGSGFYFSAGDDNLPPNIAAIVATPAGERDDKQRAELASYYLTIAPALAGARAELAAAQKEKAEFAKDLPTTLVSMAGNPRDVRILPRGNWLDDSGEVVAPAVPTFLGKLDTGDRRATRLDLAEWIASPDNPLTARTFVNRLWRLFFGAGLSRNVDDLGSQGQWPSHPELLDWLAVEFVASGWDIKHIVELIVTSDAYARAADPTPSSRERDPANRLLAHQSRFRLDAEMVRDNALAVGGILVEQVGGRSAKPYQPEGYWQHLNFPARRYSADAGESQYRRALYTHWQRSFLHPSLLAFDAPTREECTAERPRSNTPLQALVLLNDPTYVEAARAFAERIVKQGGADPAAKVRWAFRETLSRAPGEAELKLLTDLYTAQLERYTADGKAAAEALSVGLREAPSDIPAAELASWAAVARGILNLHETITRP